MNTITSSHLNIAGTNGRLGDWIQTYSGGQFWPLDPRVEEVKLIDVAHHLSLKCRFQGATKKFYSVAQHTTGLSRAIGKLIKNHIPTELLNYSVEEIQYAILHHDDSEAFLPDVPSPVKPYLQGWHDIEEKNQQVISVMAFGANPEIMKLIKMWDRQIAQDERKCLLLPCLHKWKSDLVPLNLKLKPWSPEKAEREYIATHNELWEKLKPKAQ